MKTNYFNPFEAVAMIHSRNEKATVKIIDRVGDNDYRAVYNDLICTAIYNPFVGLFYVDDKFGIVGKTEEVNANA